MLDLSRIRLDKRLAIISAVGALSLVPLGTVYLLTAPATVQAGGQQDESIAARQEKAPSLATVSKHLPSEAIAKKIEQGGGGMPEFGDVLQPDEIKLLVDYLVAKKPVHVAAAIPNPAPPIVFENTMGSSRIHFTLKSSTTPQRYSIETMAGGVALFDYNNDGFL